MLVHMRWPLPEKRAIVYLTCKQFRKLTKVINKIKNIAHATLCIQCQSLVGFVTVFCLVHIMSHFFQGNLWHQILQARLPMSQWLLRMVCPGSFAYLAKTNLCQDCFAIALRGTVYGKVDKPSIRLRVFQVMVSACTLT